MRALLQSTLIVFLLTLLLSTAAYADVNSLEATIDRNPVMLDEAIRLTVTAARTEMHSTALPCLKTLWSEEHQ